MGEGFCRSGQFGARPSASPAITLWTPSTRRAARLRWRRALASRACSDHADRCSARVSAMESRCGRDPNCSPTAARQGDGDLRRQSSGGGAPRDAEALLTVARSARIARPRAIVRARSELVGLRDLELSSNRVRVAWFVRTRALTGLSSSRVARATSSSHPDSTTGTRSPARVGSRRSNCRCRRRRRPVGSSR